MVMSQITSNRVLWDLKHCRTDAVLAAVSGQTNGGCHDEHCHAGRLPGGRDDPACNTASAGQRTCLDQCVRHPCGPAGADPGTNSWADTDTAVVASGINAVDAVRVERAGVRGI